MLKISPNWVQYRNNVPYQFFLWTQEQVRYLFYLWKTFFSVLIAKRLISAARKLGQLNWEQYNLLQGKCKLMAVWIDTEYMYRQIFPSLSIEIYKKQSLYMYICICAQPKLNVVTAKMTQGRYFSLCASEVACKWWKNIISVNNRCCLWIWCYFQIQTAFDFAERQIN